MRYRAPLPSAPATHIQRSRSITSPAFLGCRRMFDSYGVPVGVIGHPRRKAVVGGLHRLRYSHRVVHGARRVKRGRPSATSGGATSTSDAGWALAAVGPRSESAGLVPMTPSVVVDVHHQHVLPARARVRVHD